ncbi:TadE/TadG family type IV pilus assembly protein [Paenibacillus donghaensis]|uniref:Pilus assembly protein TadE n=1 Tax=Paenibacillus donghaensis TaxID=414771 RepID=A0A2Z2K9V1_9BACL|nr:TadE family protein [Paenibacillus donghaensis]ASA19553.1 pilus assembly protein TadE [Paenibacillus donghaensis]
MNRLRDDRGSFTVEASLLLPMILCITMLLLFFCLYSYQKSMLLQVASATAERAVYNWDNSNKEKHGYYAPGEYDPLYWRIGNDGLLSALFGGGAEGGGVKIELPGDAGANQELAARKLGKASAMVPDNMPGEMKYEYNLSGRKVQVSLSRLLHLPVLDGLLADGASPAVRVRSVVAEPVEFIRTVDLMRYYGAKFRGGTQGGAQTEPMNRKDAGTLLTGLGGKS